MDVSRRRAGVKSSVAAGSVWESRMKQLDEAKGGFRVFNGDDDNNNNPADDPVVDKDKEKDSNARKFPRKAQSLTAPTVASSGKRKTWKSESLDSPIQIAKGKTPKNSDEKSRELSVSADGIKKSPIQPRKPRSEGILDNCHNKELSVSVDGIHQLKNGRSEGNSCSSSSSSFNTELVSLSDDGLVVKSPIQAKKGKSDANNMEIDGNEKSPIQIPKTRSDLEDASGQLRRPKSDLVKVEAAVDSSNGDDAQISLPNLEPDKVIDDDESVEEDDEIEKSTPEVEESGSEETCKEFGVCQEKVISTSESINTTAKQFDEDDHDDDIDDDDDEIDEEIEIEVEKKSVDIKEINVSEDTPKKAESINVPRVQSKPMTAETRSSIPQQKPPIKRVVNEEKKIHHFSNRVAPTSSTVNKLPPPVLRRATLYQNLAKSTPTPDVNQCQSFPQTQNKLQSLVDLVMWRDMSRSAFVFGIGAFVIISSSYTKDLNISTISVLSYLGLVYLAAIFLYRSLMFRGVMDINGGASYVLGEEEAIWLLKLVLPYLNEFLLKIRALFSGDPATTMKMAVLLFVFARCGSSITIWKMAKLGFFGVFTVPKVVSLYSRQISAYGKFWIRRFRDAWDSCSHKKAVALAIFTLVWNLSSAVARIWAVFMMFVVVRYYQQWMMDRDDWMEDDLEEADEELCHGQRQQGSSAGVNKTKKAF